MRATVPSTHLAAPPRVDLTKRITPVLTHHGREVARFSDRATAVRRAREWGGCIVGATFTDGGTLRNATPAVQLYGPTATAHPRYAHPDTERAITTTRIRLAQSLSSVLTDHRSYGEYALAVVWVWGEAHIFRYPTADDRADGECYVMGLSSVSAVWAV